MRGSRGTTRRVELTEVRPFRTVGSDEVYERWVQRVSCEHPITRRCLPRFNTSGLLKYFLSAGSSNLWLTSSRTALSCRRRSTEAATFLLAASVFPVRLLGGPSDLPLSTGDGLTTSMHPSLFATTGVR